MVAPGRGEEVRRVEGKGIEGEEREVRNIREHPTMHQTVSNIWHRDQPRQLTSLTIIKFPALM